MKLVVTSDWHGDWSTLGVRRFPEIEAAVVQSVEHAIAQDADLYIFKGDLADPDTGGDTFHAIRLATWAAMTLSQVGIRSLWIRGNHDVCEDGTNASTLTPLAALETPEVDTLVTVVEQPRLVRLFDGLSFVCLPFMPASHGVDMREAAARLMAEALDAKGSRAAVVAHLSIPGIIHDEAVDEMPRGREVAFPFEETKRAVLRMNGHYHARQLFSPGDGGPPILIAGSLARLTFGDETHEPSFVTIEI